MPCAVILAAGAGRKLFPFNDHWPKAAITVAGTPNILRWVNQLRSAGIERIHVVGGHLESRLRYVLRDVPDIEWSSAAPTVGTAHSLLSALSEVKEEDSIVVVYGDVYAPPDTVRALLASARKNPSSIWILAKPLLHERAQDWMCAKVDEEGRVTHIFGHPRPHYVSHQLMGVYVLPTRNLVHYLQTNPGLMLNVNVGQMPPHEAHLEQTLQMMMEDGLPAYVCECSQDVVDIDKPWHIMEACRGALASELATLSETTISASARIHPSAVMDGHVVVGERVTIGRNVWIQGNAVIGDGTVIENGATIGANTIIGKDCKISDYCKIGEWSVIGNRNRIGHCAEFQGVTFDNVSFTHFGEVYGVVGESTDIAAGVTVGILGFDDLNQAQRVNGRLESPARFGNAVYIGDFSRTGIHSLLMPGVKIGSNCVIGTGVVVQEDVPPGTLLYAEQNLVRKEWSSARYGW
ncbi:MAG: NDP-sugar synthase [Alicyclobacillus sp.]|nr:NDP-sugar synthase [Alicyclobacillus sp.]